MNCPQPQRLQKLLDESLPADEQQTLQTHLESCDACQKTLEHLAAGGVTWDKTAQNLAEEPKREGTALLGALEKLQETPTSAEQTRAEAAHGFEEDLSFLQPSKKPEALGRLDKYEILSVVGKGGFGLVLKAFDDDLHRIVAIKVLAPQMAASGAARQRFIREARAAAAISHENVVGIHEVKGDVKVPYLAMQFVSGVTLNEKIDAAGPLSVKEILRIGMQIAEGLSAAHKQGLVHRDIKPGNILLENGIERVKITDFGLARAVDDASVTQSGTVAGTPMYMSPEQANGEVIDHRSDLFSLGSVLYVMATGRPPFRATSTMAVMKRVIDDTPTPMQQVNSDVPDWLCDIIAKLHAKKPEDRFQTAKEVAELLGQRLADVQAGRVITERAGSVSDGPKATVAHASGSSSRRRRIAWIVLLIASAFLVLFYFYGPWRPAGPGVDASAGTVVLGGSYDPDRLEKVVLRSGASVDGKFQRDGQRTVVLEQEPGYFKKKEKSQVSLPKGTYEIDVVCRPGYVMRTIEVSSPGPTPFMHFWDFNLMPIDVEPSSQILIEIKVEKARSEPGWVQLFNGKDLKGWTTHSPHVWKVENGHIVGTVGHLRHDKMFGDFHCRVEFRMKGKGDFAFRGVLDNWVGAPIGSKWLAENNGSLIHSLNDKVEVLVDYKKGIAAGADDWLTLEVIARGKKVTVKFNGLTTAEKTIERMLDSGFIDFKVDPDSRLEIRKIEIKELPPEPSEWVQLFNGKDLAGWKTPNQGSWIVENKILIGTRGHLRYDKIFGDFHCRLEVRRQGSGDVGFRGMPENWVATPVAEKWASKNTTGLLVHSEKDKSQVLVNHPGNVLATGEWFTLEIIAQGKAVMVKVNGYITAQKTIDRMLDRGYIDLKVEPVDQPVGVLQVRKIEIKELPPEEPGWVQLFNGKDVKDWIETSKVAGTGLWTVSDGVLIGKGAGSLIAAPSRFQNFRLRARLKVAAGVAGINFRMPSARYDTGYMLETARLKKGPGDKVEIGKLYVLQPGQTTPLNVSALSPPPDEWIDVEIIADGNRVTANVNGKEVFGVLDAEHRYRDGLIGLRLGASVGNEIHVKSLELKELPPFYKDDKVRLQGMWLAIDLEEEGKNHKDRLTETDWHFTFDGERAQLKGVTRADGKTFLDVEGALTLDTSVTPKRFRMVGLGRNETNVTQIVGLFEFQGDQLRLAHRMISGTPPKIDYPSDFQTKPGVGGQVMTFKRLTPEPGWVQLFNGKDLTGWDGDKQFWKWTDGSLVASDPDRAERNAATLWSQRTYKDFELRFQMKRPESKRDFVGVFYRTPTPKVGVPFEGTEWMLGLITIPDRLRKLGIYKLNEFNDYHVTCIGKRAILKVNGHVCSSDREYMFLPDEGVIAFQALTEFGDVVFRDLKLRELRPVASPPLAVAPFDAAKAKEYQDAWAKQLGIQPEIANSVDMKLRLIPPGKNALGPSGIGESADAFYMGVAEVTVDQFRRFVEDRKFKTAGETSKLGGMLVQSGKKTERDAKHIWSHADFARSGFHPVTLITWHDAMVFCEWLSQKEGRTYRLPTSSEWRWAERAGGASRFYFGDTASTMDAHAWFVGNSEMHTHPVGAKERNPWGLFDVYGNVWELCYDWQRGGKLVDPLLNKTGPGVNDRVVFMGGSYSVPVDGVLEAPGGPPNIGFSHLGFRVVLVGDLQAKAPSEPAFHQLFNGKDLSGWKTHPDQPGGWTVEAGELVGRSSAAHHLFSERGDYENFHLRADVKLNDEGNSGIYFRSNFGVDRLGRYPTAYEAQILHNHPTVGTTGSLRVHGPPPINPPQEKVVLLPDQWFNLEVIAQGKQLTIKVNGKATTTFTDDRYRKGYVVLQAMVEKGADVSTVVRFKKIELKELPPAPAVTP